MEFMTLIAQAISLAFTAAWLTVGSYENFRHPFLNESITSEVLDMSRLRRDYPDAYAHVAHRRIANIGTRRILFRLIIAAEVLTTSVMWVGVLALTLAALDHVDGASANAIALLGATMFTAIWAGFLVAGNWWCYWFGHEGAQNTHFQMTLWGFANMILLIAA